MEKEISASLDDKQELKVKLKSLANAHREMENKHKESLAVQMRYNAANDNTIARSKEKINELESVLREIHARLDSVPKEKIAKAPQQNGTSGQKGSHLNDKIRDSTDVKTHKIDIEMAKKQFGFILEDLERFIGDYYGLLQIKGKYEKLLEERDYILIHFGFDQTAHNNKNVNGNQSQDQEPSLVTAYKDFAYRNDENITKMKKEIEKYGGLLEENKTKLDDLVREKDDSSKRFALGASSWQSAIMNVMRKQLQDTKTDLRKRESMMSMQDEELTKLKTRINLLEQQLGNGSGVGASHSASQDFLSVQARDAVDGRLSAVSMDSVELINADTPKPGKMSRNLPPLRSSKSNVKVIPSTSPRGTVMRSTKATSNHLSSSARPQAEPVNNYITFPVGPISTPIKPETRGRPMGSVLGDLKAMNKHFNRPLLVEDARPSRKPFSNTSQIK